MKKAIATILVVMLAAPAAFADHHDTRDKTRRGAIIGAVAGGVLGAVVGNNRGSGNAKRGAVIGAAAGTAIGAGIGAYMDKQERELRRIEGIDVERTADDQLNVVVRNEVLFDFDSAALRSSSRQTLAEVSEVFRRYGDTDLVITGHTDSVGSESYNYDLSRRRAGSVSRYMSSLGVDGYRMRTVARGESQPRASNSTAQGRQLNRRVEISITARQG